MKNGMVFLKVGLLSWSLGCGREEAPTVFTRLVCSMFYKSLANLKVKLRILLKLILLSGSLSTAVGSSRMSQTSLAQGAEMINCVAQQVKA